jgi:diguanylate cyclase (GGDEF)-like protein/PAS domain S-box-containing protein
VSSSRPGAASTPFGPGRARFLARWSGALLVIAGVTGAVLLAFPPAPYADYAVVVSSVVIAVLAGLTLLSGALDHLPLGTFQVVIFLATVLAALGVYGGGGPSSGAEMLFLWLSPYAFVFFSTRQAALQTSLVAGTYAVVLAVQHRQHPGIGSAGVLLGLWVMVVASVLVVGILVRHLGRTVRDVDQRFRRGFEDSPVAAAFLDLELEFVEVNPALCNLLGRTRDELVGSSVLLVSHAGDVENARWLRAGPGRIVEDESRFLRPDGTIVWAEVAGSLVSPEIGAEYRFCQFRDVTAHRRDREALAHQAIHDPLTGLYNRTLLLDRTAAALARRDQKGTLVGLILIDLDQFKVVNDSLGHEAGDAVLMALAPLLAGAVAPTDTIGRLGGDEFLVLLDELSSPLEAVDRADRLAEAIGAPIELTGGMYVPAASIGVAVASGVEHDAAALLRDADAAMYRAKAGGRNRIEVFDRSMRYEALRRLQLEHDLRRAIAEGDLVLEYQPVVDTTTGKPVSLEGLVRWDHPSRGRIGPDEFVPLAEQTGLIVALGDWVLREAITQLAEWQLLYLVDPPLRVTVNVSGRQLAVPGFADRVAHLLRGSAIAPGSLGVEITESVIIDVEVAYETLESLRALGVNVLLDDFGTGYSSLAYLEQFPIDVLKIDRSFVARLDEGSDRAVVLEAIFAMARALHLSVIAEGVENHGQIAKLRDLGCTWIQGFVVAAPLPREEVLGFLIEQQTIARAIDRGSAR